MKKANLFLTVLLALVVFNANSILANPGSIKPVSDWQLKQEAQGIKFYVKIDSCSGSGQLYFKLKVENTGAIAVKVNFSLIPMDLPASAPVHGVIESLAAGVSVESSCTDNNDKMKVIMLPPAASISDLELLYHIE